MDSRVYFSYNWWRHQGFVEVNDTHLHKPLKNEYQKKESELML